MGIVAEPGQHPMAAEQQAFQKASAAASTLAEHRALRDEFDDFGETHFDEFDDFGEQKTILKPHLAAVRLNETVCRNSGHRELQFLSRYRHVRRLTWGPMWIPPSLRSCP